MSFLAPPRAVVTVFCRRGSLPAGANSLFATLEGNSRRRARSPSIGRREHWLLPSLPLEGKHSPKHLHRTFGRPLMTNVSADVDDSNGTCNSLDTPTSPFPALRRIGTCLCSTLLFSLLDNAAMRPRSCTRCVRHLGGMCDKRHRYPLSILEKPARPIPEPRGWLEDDVKRQRSFELARFSFNP